MDSNQIAGAIQLPRYINRELSWMAFNDRVLEEAMDNSYPLLERLKFISIVSSNLDEFFMIRVAGLEKKLAKKSSSKESDGTRTEEVLSQIREWVLLQKANQAKGLHEILALLKEKGLHLQTEINEVSKAIIDRAPELLKDIERIKITDLDQLKKLDGGRIYVFARLQDRFEVLYFKNPLDRLIELPAKLAKGKKSLHFN